MAPVLEPLLPKILYILDETKNSGNPLLSAEEISDYALKKYEEDIPVRSIINSINRAKHGLVKKHQDGRFEILGLGRNLIYKNTEKTDDETLVRRGFHPRIVAVSSRLFQDGHYSQAIFEAFKEINNSVKTKSGLSTLDGRDLMAKVFRVDNPKLRWSTLQTLTEKNEQEGRMFLFMGAIVAIRNPKAHENIIQRDRIRALEYLAFASLLAKFVDDAEVVK